MYIDFSTYRTIGRTEIALTLAYAEVTLKQFLSPGVLVFFNNIFFLFLHKTSIIIIVLNSILIAYV